ncbi:MAG: hypothetical protein WB974_04535, partial [Acidobacteriaceae bacterium]
SVYPFTSGAVQLFGGGGGCHRPGAGVPCGACAPSDPLLSASNKPSPHVNVRRNFKRSRTPEPL